MPSLSRFRVATLGDNSAGKGVSRIEVSDVDIRLRTRHSIRNLRTDLGLLAPSDGRFALMPFAMATDADDTPSMGACGYACKAK